VDDKRPLAILLQSKKVAHGNQDDLLIVAEIIKFI